MSKNTSLEHVVSLVKKLSLLTDDRISFQCQVITHGHILYEDPDILFYICSENPQNRNYFDTPREIIDYLNTEIAKHTKVKA